MNAQERKRRRSRAGFTLVELLVVIAIVAILGAVAVPKLLKNTEKARIAKATTDVKALKLAADNFQLNTGKPIASLQELVPDLLDAVPKDPWGGEYVVEAGPDEVKIKCPNLDAKSVVAGGGVIGGGGTP